MERDEKHSMIRVPRFQTVGGRRMRHGKASKVGRISCQALKTTAVLPWRDERTKAMWVLSLVFFFRLAMVSICASQHGCRLYAAVLKPTHCTICRLLH